MTYAYKMPTPKEKLVLTCPLFGVRFKQAPHLLGWNDNTYKDILRRVKDKLGAKSTTHAVALAFSQGLISFESDEASQITELLEEQKRRSSSGLVSPVEVAVSQTSFLSGASQRVP